MRFGGAVEYVLRRSESLSIADLKSRVKMPWRAPKEANPFLYGILNLEFRRAFRKILCPKSYINAQKRRSVGGNRAAHK
uniref:Uncharacterized protein n=1 Tax=Ditylenchus dipsaci TaxID=166011 RepID=A0A915E944_9BILA